jgi:hypothetical protein
MICDHSLDDAEIDVVFEVLPRPHFIITFSPFPDEPDCFVECELPDLIWQVVSNLIDDGRNLRTLSNYLRMISYEIDGLCND